MMATSEGAKDSSLTRMRNQSNDMVAVRLNNECVVAPGHDLDELRLCRRMDMHLRLLKQEESARGGVSREP